MFFKRMTVNYKETAYENTWRQKAPVQAYSIFFIIQPIPVFKPECVIFDARSAQNIHVVLTISQYSKKINKIFRVR